MVKTRKDGEPRVFTYIARYEDPPGSYRIVLEDHKGHVDGSETDILAVVPQEKVVKYAKTNEVPVSVAAEALLHLPEPPRPVVVPPSAPGTSKLKRITSSAGMVPKQKPTSPSSSAGMKPMIWDDFDEENEEHLLHLYLALANKDSQKAAKTKFNEITSMAGKVNMIKRRLFDDKVLDIDVIGEIIAAHEFSGNKITFRWLNDGEKVVDTDTKRRLLRENIEKFELAWFIPAVVAKLNQKESSEAKKAAIRAQEKKDYAEQKRRSLLSLEQLTAEDLATLNVRDFILVTGTKVAPGFMGKVLATDRERFVKLQEAHMRREMYDDEYRKDIYEIKPGGRPLTLIMDTGVTFRIVHRS